MCIGNVKHMPQFVASAFIVEECDSLSAFIYPTVELLIPKLYFSTSRSVRTLGEDEYLVGKRIFVIISCGFEERRPLLMIVGEMEHGAF
ncbi:MAG TPA: hypothetical protein DD733_10060 [Clostridiales bacterium]|nr:hypothetical protein [Clostridiales bacterium]